jgi:hypothetical protein
MPYTWFFSVPLSSKIRNQIYTCYVCACTRHGTLRVHKSTTCSISLVFFVFFFCDTFYTRISLACVYVGVARRGSTINYQERCAAVSRKTLSFTGYTSVGAHYIRAVYIYFYSIH